MGNGEKAKRILIVDDDQLVREALVCLCRADNFNVSEAKNGKEALKKVTEIKPHIIILDINLPQMDGFEVCRQLRSNPETKTTPILFVSGKPTNLQYVQEMDDPFIDSLEKPCDAGELLKKIHALLEGSPHTEAGR